MKLLIVYHAGASSNARTIFRELAKSPDLQLTAIVPEKIEIDPVYGPNGWLHSGPETELDGYRYVPIPLNNPQKYGDGFQTGPLRRLMASEHPDVIHVLDEPTSGYLFQVACERIRTCRSARTLFYGFDNLPIRFRTKYSPLKWRAMWRLLAGGAAANTEALEQTKKAGFPKGKLLERIFWGISTDAFRPINKSEAKRELNFDCEHIMGFVGRLTPEKGLQIFLEALRLLPAGVHALIVGTGPMRNQLDEIAAQNGLSDRVHFRFTTDPESVAKHMNCMDVLAVPSLTTPKWKEQYGRVIAEAMACGIPVVGSSSGAIPEVIGDAGLVVPEGDAKAVADAVRIAIYESSVRPRLQERGLVRVKECLSTMAMAQNLFGFYKRVLQS